eukprot:CAMPEP_0173264470 /NCGR_PEP_ID=MMETSP1142-20121109/27996_1 /TAXON_ID=483371 /ORGANISM="non described non described, Strain CCMP2298" /LENGTH=120 /DNA_ID=CAMNT_0014200019 /DNA_START=371 /DNA_END=733 /DNA_ORIENTATION=-
MEPLTSSIWLCLSQPDSSILAKKPPADPSIIWMDSFTLDCTLVWLLSASANTAADCRMMWMLSMLQNINSVFGYREGSSVPLPTAMLRVAATAPLHSSPPAPAPCTCTGSAASRPRDSSS